MKSTDPGAFQSAQSSCSQVTILFRVSSRSYPPAAHLLVFATHLSLANRFSFSFDEAIPRLARHWILMAALCRSQLLSSKLRARIRRCNRSRCLEAHEFVSCGPSKSSAIDASQGNQKHSEPSHRVVAPGRHIQLICMVFRITTSVGTIYLHMTLHPLMQFTSCHESYPLKNIVDDELKYVRWWHTPRR